MTEPLNETERQMLEMWERHKMNSWGNSYIASAKTALSFGVPLYIVYDMLKHREEILND